MIYNISGIPKIANTSELKVTLFMDKKAYVPWKPTEQEKENYRNARVLVFIALFVNCYDTWVIYKNE